MRSSPRAHVAGRPLSGVLLAGSGGIATAGGLLWSTVDGWGVAASVLTGTGALFLVLALVLNRRPVFGTPRGLAGVNTVLTVVLASAAFALASYLNLTVMRGGLDVTAERRFSLSDRSRTILGELERKVVVTVVLSPAELDDENLRLEEEIVQLVAQAARATGGRMEHRILGGAEDETRVLELLEELRLDPRTTECPLVIVRSGRAHRHLGAGAFVMRVRGAVRFRGEEALLDAILGVTDARKRKVYFTAGHGEGEIDLHAPGGYSALRESLDHDFLETGLLHLTRAGRVPDDAAALVILGPTRGFAEAEISALVAYLRGGGRVFALLDSKLEGSGGLERLSGMLASWGAQPLPGTVGDPGSNLQGNPHWVWITRYGEHVIVNRLEHSPSIFEQPCAIELDESVRSPRDRRLHLFPLLASSDRSWRAIDSTSGLRPGAGDATGPHVLGAAIWESRRPDDRKPESRLVVIGDATFVSNRSLDRFDFTRETHLGLFRNALNWLLEREARIAIPSRPYLGVRRITRLDISDRSIRMVMWGGTLGMPLLVLLAGVLVWLRRRR